MTDLPTAVQNIASEFLATAPKPGTAGTRKREPKRPGGFADSPLTAPLTEWDAVDRGEKHGSVVSHPSRKFQENWEKIDWLT